uniref:Uncharacterized protein n=1 Tax=Junco hyemalis TaxID=40217 RepID=A0A8C5JQV7_JUNHY
RAASSSRVTAGAGTEGSRWAKAVTATATAPQSGNTPAVHSPNCEHPNCASQSRYTPNCTHPNCAHPKLCNPKLGASKLCTPQTVHPPNCVLLSPGTSQTVYNPNCAHPTLCTSKLCTPHTAQPQTVHTPPFFTLHPGCESIGSSIRCPQDAHAQGGGSRGVCPAWGHPRLSPICAHPTGPRALPCRGSDSPSGSPIQATCG